MTLIFRIVNICTTVIAVMYYDTEQGISGYKYCQVALYNPFILLHQFCHLYCTIADADSVTPSDDKLIHNAGIQDYLTQIFLVTGVAASV